MRGALVSIPSSTSALDRVMSRFRYSTVALWPVLCLKWLTKKLISPMAKELVDICSCSSCNPEVEESDRYIR